ncbi:MAG TPA: SRPBCC family protein [Stellaceae bacterium]|nr:SRPBCC family protein [Stellaceae bacterium]
MTERISQTTHADAPIATARTPDAKAVPGAVEHARSGDTVVGRTVTINRPRGEIYAFWRDFTNLAAFMENIAEIQILDDRRSHWVVRAPAGQTAEWDAVITEDRPNECIAWASVPDARIRHSGSVRFRDAPAGRGTEVVATLAYDPPAGALGKAFAKLFQREPQVQARQDLRRFKQLMETGEVATARMRNAP